MTHQPRTASNKQKPPERINAIAAMIWSLQTTTPAMTKANPSTPRMSRPRESMLAAKNFFI